MEQLSQVSDIVCQPCANNELIASNCNDEILGIEQIGDLDTQLQAIHECVYASTVRHVLNFPLEILIQYLSTFPFYRGADTLYYLILQRFGKLAHYSSYGIHLVKLQPELCGVYVLAEQNIHARIFKYDSPTGQTIYEQVNEYITRTIICPRFQLRNNIITYEAEFNDACQIPSICLNFPKYQKIFATLINDSNVRLALIINDCWEAFTTIDGSIFQLILDRLSFVRGSMPNIWNMVLRDYYKQQLIRLKIHNILPYTAIRQITMLNTFFPELINMPNNLDALGIRIWFAPRTTRAYLLGISLEEGIPSDEYVSERLLRLKQLGIEGYVKEITGIRFDKNNLLTGYIGMVNYPQIRSKRLVNYRDRMGISLNSYYPHDLYPLIYGEDVVLISRCDVITLMIRRDMTYANFQSCFVKEIFPYIIEQPSPEVFLDMFGWITNKIPGNRGVSARIKLVELMAWDLIDYI